MRFDALVRLMKKSGRVLKSTGCVLVLGVCLTFVAACDYERATSVTVRSGPSFVLSGSGHLAIFTVYSPNNGHRIASPNPDVATVVWQIKASKGYFEGTRVEHLELVYGKPQDGYNQTVPVESQAPRLAPGTVYSFFAETTGAPAIGGFFFLGATGPIQINIPDLCLRQLNGREVSVKCGTSEPYQEPTDLEGFAREHQDLR
jgi:hypothetical protein